MTPESFAKHFHIFAEAPNSVQKLREMIIQLAVRGKLVPQNPNDEPASVLLMKIKAEKESLIKEGRIKKQKSVPAIDRNKMPYELPKGWEWTRLIHLGISHTGTTPPKNHPEYYGPGYPFIKPADLLVAGVDYTQEQITTQGISKGRLIPANSALMVCIGGSIGKVGYIDRNCSCNQQINVISPLAGIDGRFIKCWMKSPYFQQEVLSRAPQTTLPILSKGKWEIIEFPLPPLSEQKRIVTKVDQLMAFCDELEALKTKRDKNRVTLNNACMNALTSADKNSEEIALQRINDNFNLLYESPENVKALRQAILQLAVQGRLVPHDPNDESASVLLKRIKAEKETLIKEGKIKKQMHLSPVGPEEKPYELPEGWEWVRLKTLSINIHYGYNASAIPTVRDVRLLRITDIQDDKVNWDTVPGCQIDEAKLQSFKLSEGDILIARTGGTIGKSYLVTDLPVKAVFASYLIRIIPSTKIFPYYIKQFLGSEFYWAQLYSKSMGTGQPNVNGTALKSLLVPLPPLAEQKRIVAKVDQFMSLCEELESNLKNSQSQADVLVEAVVNELTTL